MPRSNMASVEAKHFAMQPSADVPRSAFNINHIHKTTMVCRGLVPVYVDDILPGDSVSLKMTAFGRLSTPFVPFMDNMIFESFFFFVPYRLVWANWERMMGELASPTDTTSFLVPQVVPTFTAVNLAQSIWDYMGITMNNAGSGSMSVSALPFRAYNMIWNEWFRDQDILAKVNENVTSDGPDSAADYGVWVRMQRPDYFTTARPWPQKPVNLGGAAAGQDPFLPGQNWIIAPSTYLGSSQIGAPITGLGVLASAVTTAGPVTVDEADTRSRSYAPFYTGTDLRAETWFTNGGPQIRVLINDLRTAVAIQKMLEKDARGGTRYGEKMFAHFKVRNPDMRLQRPEYLGGGRAFVTVSEVTQTTPTGIAGTTTEMGENAGNARVSVYDHGFSHSFTEHGVLLGLVNVRADTTYQQGIRKMWFKRSQYDFFWPELEGMGEQAILSREIYADGTGGDQGVFGYQERWSEYKWHPNRTSGYFRSTQPLPLDIWHVAREYAVRPTLNGAFMEDNPPFDRVLQVSQNNNAQFLLDMLFQVRMVRPMRTYSVPGIVGRF